MSQKNRRRRLAKQPLNTSSSRAVGSVYGLLRVDQSQNALGIGLFAQEDIPAGTRIMREEPLACVRFASIQTGNVEFDKQYASIGPLARKNAHASEALGEVLIMRGANKEWLSKFGSGAVDTVSDLSELANAVCRFNAFSINTPICAMPYAYGLYDVTTMLNHSCGPNAMQFFSGKASSDLVVRTLRDVKKGEEVTVSYTIGLEECENMLDRRNHLLGDLGFICICERCLEQTVSGEMKSPDDDEEELPEECMEKLVRAKKYQVMSKPKESWKLYCEVLTKARSCRIGDDKRFNILLGAASSGVRCVEKDGGSSLMIQAVLKKVMNMCSEKGPLHMMMEIQLAGVQAHSLLKTDKRPEEALKTWMAAKIKAYAFFGIEDFSTVLDSVFCPRFMVLEKFGIAHYKATVVAAKPDTSQEEEEEEDGNI